MTLDLNEKRKPKHFSMPNSRQSSEDKQGVEEMEDNIIFAAQLTPVMQTQALRSGKIKNN